MDFLDWEDSYNTGIKEIDLQHRGLFELISKLFKTKHVYKSDNYFIVTLDLLMKYVKLHFETEERYMRDANYSKINEHINEHTMFLQNLSKLSEELEKNDSFAYQKILNYLKEWYIKHILGTDRDYIETIQRSLKSI